MSLVPPIYTRLRCATDKDACSKQEKRMSRSLFFSHSCHFFGCRASAFVLSAAVHDFLGVLGIVSRSLAIVLYFGHWGVSFGLPELLVGPVASGLSSRRMSNGKY